VNSSSPCARAWRVLAWWSSSSSGFPLSIRGRGKRKRRESRTTGHRRCCRHTPSVQ